MSSHWLCWQGSRQPDAVLGIGRLNDFGMDRGALEVLAVSGEPFQISRCPGMAKRFSPAIVTMAGDIRSFPLALNARGVALARRQMQGNDVNISDEEASK